MVTFFSILFILIAVNAVLLIFSVNRASRKSVNNISKQTAPKIYALDLATEYKKAI